MRKIVDSQGRKPCCPIAAKYFGKYYISCVFPLLGICLLPFLLTTDLNHNMPLEDSHNTTGFVKLLVRVVLAQAPKELENSISSPPLYKQIDRLHN
jgi:hypothetical protein